MVESEQVSAVVTVDAEDKGLSQANAERARRRLVEAAKSSLTDADDEHERLLAALRASRCGTWRWEIAEDIVEWDEALCQVYRVARAAAPRNAKEFLALVHPDDRDAVWGKVSACIETGAEAEYEFRTTTGGEVRWIYDRSALVRNPDGTPRYMLGACFDVTDRRRIEEERDAALRRQTLLLHELGHRVKNHLSMVTSLLRMKASRQKDPVAVADFQRAIERVNTIAYLHDHLYRSDSVETVDVRTYLGDICDNLQLSLLAETEIALHRDLEAFNLHVDQAVPVGLIVNELITNAAKYAFNPGQKGRITVRFHVRGDRAIVTISDDGRGTDVYTVPGVGTKLIRSLAGQIGARLRIVSRNGLTCSLSFRPTSVG